MSSWFSQSTEILLSQKTYCLDTPQNSATPSSSSLSKYKITLFPNKTNDFSKLIKISSPAFQAKKETSSSSLSSCKVASSKEKILQFGSSITSQLPKKAQTTTSSPWNLFSNQQYKASIKNLFHQMQRFEASTTQTEQKEAENLQLKQEHISYLYPSSKTQPNQTPHRPVLSHPNTNTHSSLRSQINKQSFTKPSSQEVERQQELQQKVVVSGRQQLSYHENDAQQQKQNPPFSYQNYKKHKSPRQIIPVLIPPTIGIFSLGYLLTKQGILSDFSAYAIYKDNLDASQKEMDACHQERLDLIKQAIEKESNMSAWNAFTRILEWAATWINLGIATVSVISSGGVFAIGALVASIIVLIINIIDELDGWKTIVKLLPGKNKERKSQLLSIVKYALFIMSALISVHTIYADSIPASSIMQGAIVAIPPALQGFIALLRGTLIALRSRLFKIKESFLQVETQIDIHNWERNDYLSRAEELLTNLENNFEQLTRILHLHYETTQMSIHCLK